jgi:hypothetical protein
MMKKLIVLVFTSLITIWLVTPLLVFAGGEGLDVPESLDRKVELEGLSGISYFFAWAYNNNLWLYAVSCTVSMAVIGMAIAYVTDFILRAVGLETHKIEHRE